MVSSRLLTFSLPEDRAIGPIARLYDELTQRSLEQEIAAADRDPVTGVLRGAEPFHYPGGPHGVVLVHGFSNTPGDTRPLGARLAAQGFTVHGVLLPGHGRTPRDLERSTWEDWFCEVEYAVERLGRDCARVSVVGFSTGGLLALHLAATRPAARPLHRLVCLSPFLALRRRWFYVLPPERFFALGRGRIRYVRKPRPGNINDPDVRRTYLSYRHIPLKAVASALECIDRVRAELPAVRSPILLMHSRGDQTCAPEGTQEVYDRVASAEKKLVFVERSNHVITLDYDRPRVEEEVLRWLGEDR
ncbi:MAG: alpha/beta fold hydrolase [Planctomycetes bacterium]|nr:alpha/beta fold hydrolase [Planctomycetota bacterium]